MYELISDPKLTPFLIGLFTGSIPGALVALFAAIYSASQTRRMASENRVRELLVPLQYSAIELHARITKIAHSLEYDWLNSAVKHEVLKGDGFAKDPRKVGYFYVSTGYLFARYFASLERIYEVVGYAASPKRKIGREISINLDRISRAFQWKEVWNDCKSISYNFKEGQEARGFRDAYKLHRQFQHAIGELMIERSDGRTKLASFRSFLTRYREEEEFRYWLLLIEEYYEDLKPCDFNEEEPDIRIFRIVLIGYWLERLIESLSIITSVARSAEELRLDEILPSDIVIQVKKMAWTPADSYFTGKMVK